MNMSNKNIENIYPLSRLKEGMLFHSLYAPDSGVYVEQMCCGLSGELNVSDFRRACQKIVDRYSILRTAFVWKGMEQPLQAVGRKVQLPFEELDWRGVSSLEREERLESYIQEERQRGFKLSKAPLMRLT